MTTNDKSLEPYTPEEVRQQLYSAMRGLCQYWAGVPGCSVQEQMEGLCFSILNIIDGGSLLLPAMDIHLSPHESDPEYYREQGERWYEPQMLINNCAMHEEWATSETK